MVFNQKEREKLLVILIVILVVIYIFSKSSENFDTIIKCEDIYEVRTGINTGISLSELKKCPKSCDYKIISSTDYKNTSPNYTIHKIKCDPSVDNRQILECKKEILVDPNINPNELYKCKPDCEIKDLNKKDKNGNKYYKCDLIKK